MHLTSKLQYKRSEKGEFHDIAKRELNDTIVVIHNYPWDTERSNASVELTCPSITIEHPSGTYLKIGPYFSGKYSLYYLKNNSVYLKTVNTLDEVCEEVKTYFDQKGQLQRFDKYGFTINALKHFKTYPFVYSVNAKASLKFFNFYLIMICATVFMVFLRYLDYPQEFKISTLFYVLLFFTTLCSPLFYLFFNYLDADRNNFIRISKGHDDFTFGTLETEKTYSKQDISAIISYGPHYRRSLWGECEVFIITFKNGEEIKFTSLLISAVTLWIKFPDHKILNQKKFFPTYQSIP